MQAKTTLDLKENIAAMCIAILGENISIPEQAFAALQGKKHRLTYEDTLDMVAMKEDGMYYREIAKIYGVDHSLIYKRIYRYKKETSLDGSPKRSAI